MEGFMDLFGGYRRHHDKVDNDQHVHVHHRIEVHVHGDPGSQAILQDILKGVVGLQKQGVVVMGKVEDMRQELGEINDATNRQATASAAIAATAQEIATDVDALIANQGGGLTDADVQSLRDLKEKALQAAQSAEDQRTFLESVAAKYPVVPPADGGGGETGGGPVG